MNLSSSFVFRRFVRSYKPAPAPAPRFPFVTLPETEIVAAVGAATSNAPLSTVVFKIPPPVPPLVRLKAIVELQIFAVPVT